MKEMPPPLRLNELLGAAFVSNKSLPKDRVYLEYFPAHLKNFTHFISGLFRITIQYSSRTSSSISTVVE